MESTMTKKWVFDALVKDENDVEGLLAYAMYKHAKSELAKALRQQGLMEPAIQSRLDSNHDNIVSSLGQLNVYRNLAAVLLGKITDNVAKPLKEQHALYLAQEDARTKKIIDREIKNFSSRLIKQTNKEINTTLPWWQFGGFTPWLFSGIPGALATVALSTAILAFFLLTKTTAEEKERALDKGFGDIKSVILPNKSDDSNVQEKKTP